MGSEKKYKCVECGALLAKEDGGAAFTVCSDCWDRLHGKEVETWEPESEGGPS